MNSRRSTAVLVLALVGVTGCASTNRATATSQPAATSATADLAPTASTLPPEFAGACGHPGAEVTVDSLPVHISHHDCDLAGVVIRYGTTTLTVPASVGGAASAAGGGSAAPGGATSGSEIDAEVDPTTGDVTITGSAQVAVPAGAAAAQDVVRRYVAALNAHDITTARHYLTPAHAAQVAGEADSWFTDLISATNLSVHPVIAGPCCGVGDGYTQSLQVYVDVTLTFKHPESLPNGKNLWSYILVRNSDADPWLIADEGLG